MVPLVMSTSREDNPHSAFEEFATHLSLYDDSFHFVERSAPTSALPISVVDDTKGSLPPSVFCPISKNVDDVTTPVKVKRKCGRPRNPIPRHKRESHINAEHRRRGKIQDGFRTLKNIVPKYEQTSGRDSKADILFKAVDYCKLLQNDIKELSSSIEALKAEKDVLSVDIKNYKTLVPDMSTYDDDLAPSIDDRYTEYVQYKTKENWTFGTFKVIMRPLFESYKLSVRGESMGEFLRSVADWATSSLSLSNLRTVCLKTLRNVPTKGSAGHYKDDLMSDTSSLESANSVAHSLTSDSNNNRHCLNSQAFMPEHFSCYGSAGNVSSSDSVRTSGTQVYSHTFDNTHATINSSPPMSKGAHANMQNYQDMVPFNGSNVCNNSSIFSDLYYNLDQELRQHHLNLARTGSGFDHWSHLRLQHQHNHYYQNNPFPPTSHYPDLKKVHPFWGSEHQRLSQHMTADLSSGPSVYYHPSFSDGDFRYDLFNPRDGPDTLSAPLSYLSHPTNYLNYEHSRPKHPSQSSSESEGSLLNMDTFAKQTTETLGEHEKYGQLSPCTDSCISSGSSVCVTSPGVLSGRNADHAFPYRNTSSMDHLKQHKSALYERADNVDSQLTMSLASYGDTFGMRTAEQHRNLTRFDGEVMPQWGVRTSKNALEISSKQPSSERLESSSLLAEMLGQSQLLQTRSSHHPVDSMILASPHSNGISISNTYPVKSSTANKMTDHLINGFPVPVKLESSYVLPSFPVRPGTENACPTAKDLPSTSPKGRQLEASLNCQSNCFTAQTQLEVKSPSISNSSWLQPYVKPQSSSDLEVSTTAKFDEAGETQDGTQNQMCYFEMAHRQLLKHHSLSTNNPRVREFKSTDLAESPKQASPHTTRHGVDILNSETDRACNVQTPTSPTVTDTGLFLRQSNHGRPPPQMCLVSRQKVPRKSPFEDSYPEDHQLQAVSGCKKTCQWQELEKTSPNLPAKGGSPGSYETTREIDCVEKLVVATL